MWLSTRWVLVFWKKEVGVGGRKHQVYHKNCLFRYIGILMGDQARFSHNKPGVDSYLVLFSGTPIIVMLWGFSSRLLYGCLWYVTSLAPICIRPQASDSARISSSYPWIRIALWYVPSLHHIKRVSNTLHAPWITEDSNIASSAHYVVQISSAGYDRSEVCITTCPYPLQSFPDFLINLWF